MKKQNVVVVVVLVIISMLMPMECAKAMEYRKSFSLSGNTYKINIYDMNGDKFIEGERANVIDVTIVEEKEKKTFFDSAYVDVELDNSRQISAYDPSIIFYESNLQPTTPEAINLEKSMVVIIQSKHDIVVFESDDVSYDLYRDFVVLTVDGNKVYCYGTNIAIIKKETWTKADSFIESALCYM